MSKLDKEDSIIHQEKEIEEREENTIHPEKAKTKNKNKEVNEILEVT